MTAVTTMELQSVSKVFAGGQSGRTGKDFVQAGYPAYGAGGVNGHLNSFEYDGEAVILSSIGARCGKVFYPEGKWSSLANTQLIFPDQSRVDRRFLWYQINDEARWHRSGTAQPYIKPSDIKTSRVYLPPLPEQRRIAAILDQADELRTKRRRALTLLDELADSLFTDMFWQGTSQSTFKELSIAEACSVVVDCVNKTAPLSETPTEFKMIRTTNVRNMRVDISSVRYVDEETFLRWNSRLTPRRGDVILTREAPAGEAGILQSDDNVFLGQRLMLYRPDTQKLLPEYLLFALMSPLVRMRFDRVASGSTVKHLSVPFCRSFELPIPEITLQAKFSVRINGISKTRELAERASLEADELFASLQHRAFRGEL